MREENLISPKQLAALIGSNPTNLSILDASWYLPVHGRDGKAEFDNGRIPGAQYFDIDAISDPDNPLPHMFPSPTLFAGMVGELGVSEADTIVVYDGMGIFSCARAWFMFKVMGAKDVRVLEGGFDGWKKHGHPVDTNAPVRPAVKSFASSFDANRVKSITDMKENLQTGQATVLDARSKERFDGVAPEPRAGLRSGHIPGSLSMPFTELMHDGTLRPEPELSEILSRHGVREGLEVITTCGSGVSAAIISLALDTIGHRNHSLYDGSWSEWGQADGVPVNTTETPTPKAFSTRMD